MNTKVLRAVFKRNFVSYLANPTGYVFVCVFVLLSTIAAFWPNEFFVTNLANLDQLNKMFPFIMLVFIPAVTMSIWADERRQGTDELLLTIPAADLDVVIGKYLAAVAIYSVALLFSLFCNYAVLGFLGEPDAGLFLGTYVGYWMVGLAMLAVGMVASFLTGNLTVAYVLGAVFNLPLVFAVHADVILGQSLSLAVKQWSIAEQFRDFGRGIISLSGLAYFGTIVAVLLYVSMVLIARRHWIRGSNALVLGTHYSVRALALAVIGVSAVVAFENSIRVDVTRERLSSLSPTTVKLLKDLQVERPVQIEAFISPTVPEAYVQTRLDLLSMLRELDIRGGEKVRTRVNDTEQFSEEAALAEQRYDITPREVTTMDRGSFSRDQVFMGVAFTCGLEKVILPFIDRGIPVEYELVRSVATVTQQKRKKVGVLETDAQLYGRFNMQTMSSSSNWPIIDELEKQYDVERVDATSPISEKYDVLLAVQPSSLGPEQMDNFVAAVRSGIPTAIFEDPFPFFAGNVPSTTAPRRPMGGMNPMMGGMGQQPQEKGNRAALWDLLKVEFAESKIVWQDYNPYPRYSDWPNEFVFVDKGTGADEPFNESTEATSGLQHMLFVFPGSVRNLNVSNLKFTPLVETGDQTGTVGSDDVIQPTMFGMGGSINPNRRQSPTGVPYVLAARIQGDVEPGDVPHAGHDHAASGNGDGDHAGNGDGDGNGNGDAEDAEPSEDTAAEKDAEKEEEPAKPRKLDVVLVADIDMLHREFFRLREMGDVPEAGVRFDFDNVTFVLNVLDTLAGDDRFLEIRKRRPKHRTLTRIEKRTKQARKDTARTVEELRDQYEQVEKEEEKILEEKIREMEERMKKTGGLSLIEVANRVGMAQRDGERRKQIKLEQLQKKRDRDVNRIETELSLKIRRLQDTYKMWAVILPPIPPFLVALAVFFTRRSREREGVARGRLRSGHS